MNERIRELANIWANRRSEDEKLGITYTFSEKALETFAELVVRECAKVAVEHEDYCEMKMIPTYAIDMHILEHFGVEE